MSQIQIQTRVMLGLQTFSLFSSISSIFTSTNYTEFIFLLGHDIWIFFLTLQWNKSTVDGNQRPHNKYATNSLITLRRKQIKLLILIDVNADSMRTERNRRQKIIPTGTIKLTTMTKELVCVKSFHDHLLHKTITKHWSIEQQWVLEVPHMIQIKTS